MRTTLFPWYLLLTLLLLSRAPLAAEAGGVFDLLEEVRQRPHVETVAAGPAETVRDHLVGLGAIEKIRGAWSPRDSERLSGELTRRTWRILDGFSSAEVLERIAGRLEQDFAAQLTFACEGYSCGSSVQWANRMFRQRILYGTDVSQRYRAYRLGEAGSELRVLLYASARSAERQYLHAEVLVLDDH
jgi:hypothetical protein